MVVVGGGEIERAGFAAGDFIEYTSRVDACDVAREESGSTSKDEAAFVDRTGTGLMEPGISVERLLILSGSNCALPFMLDNIDRERKEIDLGIGYDNTIG